MAKRLARFQTEPSETYDSYPLTSAALQTETAKANRQSMLVRTPGVHDKRAVWIVHGMGQQVRFETLEALTNGLTEAAKRAFPNATVPDPTFGEVQVDSTVLQRVKLHLPKDDGGTREVHLYESYWAPKTEGVVNLKEVIGFLWDGGTRGLINCVTKFQRALFGTMVPFNTNPRTPVYLLGTLLVLASLMVINAVILATGGKFLGLGQNTVLSDPAKVYALTTIGDIVSCIALTFGCVLFLAESCRPGTAMRKAVEYWRNRQEQRAPAKKATTGRSAVQKVQGKLLTYGTWVGVAFTSTSIICGAFLMLRMSWIGVSPWLTADRQANARLLANGLTLLTLFLVGAAVWLRRYVTSGDPAQWAYISLYFLFWLILALHLFLVGGILCAMVSQGAGPHGLKWLGWAVWVWPFLIVVSAMARTLIVQFVGDVTVYISSNKIDRFDAVRQAIKKLAKDDASAVFSAKAHGKPAFEYEKVAIVGHSLGSVIAYDTLNRLAADDALSGRAADIAGRTSLLLTFGSPLDKIAFFFTIMSKSSSHVREQLASVVQPMIEDKQLRVSVPWVNVYSRNDVICGPLDFYDAPGLPKDDRVHNLKDEDAIIPLIAHVEYWTNTVLWDTLLQVL